MIVKIHRHSVFMQNVPMIIDAYNNINRITHIVLVADTAEAVNTLYNDIIYTFYAHEPEYRISYDSNCHESVENIGRILIPLYDADIELVSTYHS